MVESSDLSKTCCDHLSDDYLQLENIYLTSKVNFDLRGQNKSLKNHNTFHSLINSFFGKLIFESKAILATKLQLRSFSLCHKIGQRVGSLYPPCHCSIRRVE